MAIPIHRSVPIKASIAPAKSHLYVFIRRKLATRLGKGPTYLVGDVFGKCEMGVRGHGMVAGLVCGRGVASFCSVNVNHLLSQSESLNMVGLSGLGFNDDNQ